MPPNPVENDVEFLFIECLFRTWRAAGDTSGMQQYLDHAVKAVEYAMTDRYRWSAKYGLLKCAHTIDTWDFMHADDSRLTLGDNVCDIDKATFGVMHGDNTGMAAGCRCLARMLRAWRGANDTFENAAVFIWGWDNPRSDTAVASLTFRAASFDVRWWVGGITACDRPVWFPQRYV